MALTDHKKSDQPDSGILVVSQSRPTKANCWSCGAMRAAHFCQECGKVQPPAPVDYFTFFGLPFRLNLEPEKLEREFYALSRHLHPDINAINSDREQQWSLEKSSQLNDAYRTLKDPITRTEYLLRLQGVQMEEQSKAATEEARRTGKIKKQVVPSDLLEQVFELNMQLEEMRMNKKMGEPDRTLERELQDSKKQLQDKVQRPAGRAARSLERVGCLDRPRRAGRKRSGRRSPSGARQDGGCAESPHLPAQSAARYR